MQSVENFLAEKREVTIHTIVSYLRAYLQENAQRIWRENEDELLQLYARVGDPAYGVYGRKLFLPVFEQITKAGYVLDSYGLANSLEYWGPPEERERCMWQVIKRADGFPLGALVSRTFHDHTCLRLPRPIEVFALEESEQEAIIAALSHASVRLKEKELIGTHVRKTGREPARARWEYSVEIGLADTLDASCAEMSEGMLDHSLALWGAYGWELTGVIPYQQRLIAFFKRPLSES